MCLTNSLSGAWARRRSMFSGSMSGNPEVCRSRSRTWTLSRSPPLKSGRYWLTGSPRETSPRSTSSIKEHAVTGFVIEASRNTESGLTGGAPSAGESRPKPRCRTTRPCRATRMAAAPTRPDSTSDWISPEALSNCDCDTPAADGGSGFNWANSEPASTPAPKTLISACAIYFCFDSVDRAPGRHI